MQKGKPKIGKAVETMAGLDWPCHAVAVAAAAVGSWQSSGTGNSGTAQEYLAEKGSPTKAEKEAMG